ncbi:hypothetical protein KFL_003780090 [Klebsormidium nitens]|uniref:Man1/Src1-like C-terminal domain-containing protein n=1 Tax=Klebsormidium nitens TaxID=105231 RepID=A0A1Y1IB67_KLENI|nr:hypothetical protein KFL_003780090 [Klebsormidium nitens]|eukprot:GAQ87803.1 hypothetical protein KFL_003780090 [Klebsormidium nitens]
MASAKKNFESMTVAQLQDYLRGEGVELPAKTQLKKYYVGLAVQQSELSAGNLTSPRTRWGSEPVELRTSPLGGKDGKAAEKGEASEMPQQEGAASSSKADRTGTAVPRQPGRSERDSVSQRLRSPERGRPIKQEGGATPYKSPRRMREMSPLRRAKSPLRRKAEAAATRGDATTSTARKTLDETLFGGPKTPPQASKPLTQPQPEPLAAAAEVKQERVPKKTKKAGFWVPSFFQRSKRENVERSSREEVRTMRVQNLGRRSWGAAKAGWELLSRILSVRPPQWLVLLLALGMVVALAISYLQAALRPIPFCDTGASPVGSQCIPCPEHGHCESGHLTCAVGYEKVGRHCVKDKRVEARVQKLAGKVKRFACQQRGLALCGYNASEAVTRASVMGMLGEGQTVDQRTADIFSLAVQRAGEELLMAAENGVPVLVCPDDLARQYKPLSCLAREAAQRNWKPLALLLLSILGALYFWRRRRQQQALVKAAETLYEKICAELEDAAQRPGGAPKWKIATHFRDSLLKPRERGGALWKEVDRLAREDTRVLVRQQMVQGESFTVWEWREAGALLSPTFKGTAGAPASGTPSNQPTEALVRRRPSNETPSRTNGTPSRIYPSTNTINIEPVRWKF